MKSLRGQTLRVHRIDLNDPTNLPQIPASHRYAGWFLASPVTGVRLVDIQSGKPVTQGTLVLVYEKTNVP